MQNTPKLLQCTQTQKRSIYFNKWITLYFLPKSSSPAFFPSSEAACISASLLRTSELSILHSNCLAFSSFDGKRGQQAKHQQATARAGCAAADLDSLGVLLSGSRAQAQANHNDRILYLPWSLHYQHCYLNEWLIHTSCLKDHNRKYYTHLYLFHHYFIYSWN